MAEVIRTQSRIDYAIDPRGRLRQRTRERVKDTNGNWVVVKDNTIILGDKNQYVSSLQEDLNNLNSILASQTARLTDEINDLTKQITDINNL